MIKVIVKNNVIKISGHACFLEYGKDIVCASVSSVIYTCVNCIKNIDSSSIDYNDDGTTIRIEKIKDNESVNIIINTMIEILKDLERQYKKNIKIESEE